MTPASQSQTLISSSPQVWLFLTPRDAGLLWSYEQSRVQIWVVLRMTLCLPVWAAAQVGVFSHWQSSSLNLKLTRRLLHDLITLYYPNWRYPLILAKVCPLFGPGPGPGLTSRVTWTSLNFWHFSWKRTFIEFVMEASTSAPRRKPVAIITIGMAGAGKSTFVQRINSYLHSLDPPTPPYILNLDPAVTHVPFEANIDIRDTVNYQEVMKQYVCGWLLCSTSNSLQIPGTT